MHPTVAWALAHPDEPLLCPIKPNPAARNGTVRRTPSLRQRIEESTPESLSDRVCWNWTGRCDRRGRGQIRLPDLVTPGEKAIINAPRAVYILYTGNITPVTRHTCDNPQCVNPKHLLGGTQIDNMQDRSDRGRHWQMKKTRCEPFGHLYDEANTGYSKTGHRYCKTCHRLAAQRLRAALRV